MEKLLTPIRLLFGAWMLLSGLNHFFGSFMPVNIASPIATEALAVQLMDALTFSRLFDVAMGIQMVAGALILIGFFTPLALAVIMPVNIGALYWALILEHSPLWSLLAFLAVALGAFLMLAHLNSYQSMLHRHPLALAERDENGRRYETLYSRPRGRTPPIAFALALLPIAGAAYFFYSLLPPPYSKWNLLVLAVPLAVLVVRAVQGLFGRD